MVTPVGVSKRSALAATYGYERNAARHKTDSPLSPRPGVITIGTPRGLRWLWYSSLVRHLRSFTCCGRRAVGSRGEVSSVCDCPCVGLFAR